MKKILLVVLIVFFNMNCFSKDLGVIGTIYEINETNLIDYIKSKAQEKINNGDLSLLSDKMKSNSLSYAKRPEGILLPRAVLHKAVEIIPSYILKKDIVDSNGNVLYKKGIKINPLKIKPLTKVLCFIDGDDKDQVKWMKKYCSSNPKNKMILVNGSYLDVSKEIGKKVYFDQKSFLVNKLEIQALPTILRQVGEKLYVEQIPIDK